MRARVKFSTNSVEETILGIMRENYWLPDFGQNSDRAQNLIEEVRGTVDDEDVELFNGTKKILLWHTPTECRGTLSCEHNVWVVRLLNSSVPWLQSASAMLVSQLVEHANANRKTIGFPIPIQIVERKSKQTIIEGLVLATFESRREYARSHRGVELRISKLGLGALVFLLVATCLWSLFDGSSWSDTWPWPWFFSVLEKFIGSAAVTTVISYIQYRFFLQSLKDHTIRWNIPGDSEKLDVKAQATAA